MLWTGYPEARRPRSMLFFALGFALTTFLVFSDYMRNAVRLSAWPRTL